ncbi:FG-GAP repeat domain-containing protein [Mesorhizobium sp. L-8-3]|uniref:FG-GAP repeat domain-containing protein n=1 Tax=Mesorhizobium sp. L-8-3 TaxID=2744522 RepID=UPI001928FCB0|nr:VCBS repeat-containing protein [Mesorhizobium sp. L-8-3]BCH27804.1 RNA-binding protein [Mesorhizobium sp. L-8-3]
MIVTDLLRRHAAKLFAVAVIGVCSGFAMPPRLSNAELKALAAPLKFTASYFSAPGSEESRRNVRQVHPDLAAIDAWISSVGAGVALADISGSGRPSDICIVDPRGDSVAVMPVPGSSATYAAFTLPTPSTGYSDATLAPMGCLPADFNEDGYLDLLVYYWGRTPVVFIRNPTTALSDTAFLPTEIISGHEIWNTNAAVLADIDGDGHPDLVFGNYFQDGARVLDATATERFEMQHSMSRAFNAGRDRVLLWKAATISSVTYTDASAALPDDFARGWTLALGARDLTDDQLPELYIANDFGPDRLFINRSTIGHPAFELVVADRDLTTPRSKVLGQDSFKGMGIDFGDVVGDGRAAIAVSNIAGEYALLESHFLFVRSNQDSDYPRFRDVSGELGTWKSNWAWDVKFVDVLNSGTPGLLQAIGFVRGERNAWPTLQELAMGNDELLSSPEVWPRFSPADDLSGQDHDRLFIADATGYYHDVWPALGLDNGTISRGIATGDVFGDGRLSIAIARQWQPSLFLRNLSETGRAIVVDLRVSGAVGGLRAAIGAEARVTLPNGRIVTSIVDGGNGHGGKRAPEIHLGLGEVAENASFAVQFIWRDANGQHAATLDLVPGRHQLVLQPDGIVEEVRK